MRVIDFRCLDVETFDAFHVRVGRESSQKLRRHNF